MLKRGIAATAAIIAFTSSAHAGQSGDYVGISSGALLSPSSTFTDQEGSNAKMKYDTLGFPVNFSIGRQFGNGWRIEGELFYKTASTREFKYSDITAKSNGGAWSVGSMTNVYYDWFHDAGILPEGPSYIGAGVGFANINMSGGNIDGHTLWNRDSDTVFAYQAIIGSAIPINKILSLDISYRYFGTTDITIDQIKTSYSNHNIVLGVRYYFR